MASRSCWYDRKRWFLPTEEVPLGCILALHRESSIGLLAVLLLAVLLLLSHSSIMHRCRRLLLSLFPNVLREEGNVLLFLRPSRMGLSGAAIPL